MKTLFLKAVRKKYKDFSKILNIFQKNKLDFSLTDFNLNKTVETAHHLVAFAIGSISELILLNQCDMFLCSFFSILFLYFFFSYLQCSKLVSKKNKLIILTTSRLSIALSINY